MKTLENQREQTIASERYCPVLSTEYNELFRALTNRLKDTLPLNRTRIIGEELNRVAGIVEEKDLECKKYMAALSVLVDLSLQGWVFDFQDNQLTLKMENNKMVDFPLLKERISYYNKNLSACEDVFAFVEKHSRRISWQIMRIYRNRNLIIHNGRSMPYLPLLIENLHSYVDIFMDYIIDGFYNGNGKEQIYQELFLKECDWLAKIKVKRKLIDEEIVEYLFS